MFTPILALAPEHLQLGEGLLLVNADLPAILEANDPGEALAQIIARPEHVLGTAAEGCVFRCARQVIHTEKRGQRTPTANSTLPGPWDVTLSGTLTAVTPANAACLLGAPDPGQTRFSAVAPCGSFVSPDSLCWIGTTADGLMLIDLHAPLSTGGLQFRSGANGVGRTPFTFTARQRCPSEDTPPCSLYFLKDGDAA